MIRNLIRRLRGYPPIRRPNAFAYPIWRGTWDLEGELIGLHVHGEKCHVHFDLIEGTASLASDKHHWDFRQEGPVRSAVQVETYVKGTRWP